MNSLNPTSKNNYPLPADCERICKPSDPNCYINSAAYQKCVRTGLTTQSKVVKKQYQKHGNSVHDYCRKKYCSTLQNKMYL